MENNENMAIKKLSRSTSEIVIPEVVMTWIESNSEDDGKENLKDKVKLSLKEVTDLKANLSLLRSSSLYLIDISVHMGRGTSNLTLDLEDIIPDEDKSKVFKKNVRTTIKMSQLLTDAANKLRSRRGSILEKYFCRFGEINCCPAENLAAVEEAIKELLEEADKQRQIICELLPQAKRAFLMDIADILVTNGFSEEKQLNLLLKYSRSFPSQQEIRNQVRVCITPPLRLPSIGELIEKDSVLTKCEAERAIAQTTIQSEKSKQDAIRLEAEAVRKLKEDSEAQMRSHLNSVIETARLHLLSLVEEKLDELLERPPINDIGGQRRFQQFMNEMQVFLEHQDGSLQDMYQEIAGLESLFDGTSQSADSRRENLEAKVKELSQKYEPKFDSSRTLAQGHRTSSLAGMDL